MSQNNVNVVATLNATENAVVAGLNRLADAADRIGQGIPAAHERAQDALSGAAARIRAGVSALATMAAETVEDCQDILAGLDGLLAGVFVAVPALPEPEVVSLPGPVEAETASKAANGPVETSKAGKPVKLRWVKDEASGRHCAAHNGVAFVVGKDEVEGWTLWVDGHNRYRGETIHDCKRRAEHLINANNS
jgi:hypothetical protein